MLSSAKGMFPVLSNLRRIILKWMRWCYLNFIGKAFGNVSTLNLYLPVYFRLSEPHRYFSVAPETLVTLLLQRLQNG